MLSFMRNRQSLFQSGCTILHSHQQSSCCSTALSAFGIVSVPDFSHSNRCAVVSHCFNLYFPGDTSCGTSFHMLICYLYMFFGKMSVKIFGSFYNQVISLLLHFKSPLYNLENSPLSNMSSANIFSQPVAYLFILLTAQKFLILRKPSLLVISFKDYTFGVIS